jgi:signal transduction histidine kinase
MNLSTIGNETAASIPAVASIVHDLRNPLSAIHGSAELLIGSRLSQPQVHRIAQNVYGASVRIRELLDEFLSRYQETDQRLEPCDLRELVAGAVVRIALLAESQAVQVIQNVPENLSIAVDRHCIRRVLVNLFVNALDVMPHGGTIRVSAVPGRNSILIRVRDTGPGVAAEIRSRLFEPFATAGKERGLGLGLAFSRQAVMDHGGQMWLESDRDGACFAFCLPSPCRQS